MQSSHRRCRDADCFRIGVGAGLAAALALLLAVTPARAATKTWDGSSSGNWNLNANWAGSVKPANGDDLVFPAGPTRLTTTNDFTNLQLNSITFSTGTNYTLRGNALTVSNGITNRSAGIDILELGVTSAANQTFNCNNASGFLYFRSDVVLNAATSLTNSGNGRVIYTGIISGTGNLVKTGAGTTSLQGSAANTYTGTTTVKAGLLEMSKAGGVSVPSGLTVGGSGSATARELAGEQIGGNVTVNGLGLLDLNGHSDTIAALTLVGGDVTTGAGTLTLAGNLTAGTVSASGTSTISGHLSLGIANRIINVINAVIGVNPTELILAASVSGSAGVGFTKSGGGTLRLNSGNSYSGVTTVSSGLLQVNSPTALGSTSSGTVLIGGRLEIIEGLTINNEWLTNNSASSKLELLAGAGPVVWSGNVVLNADLNVSVVSANKLSISGVISGNAGINKDLPGTLEYSGTFPNTYAGTTTVRAGLLGLAVQLGHAVAGPLIAGDGTNSATIIIENNGQIGFAPVTLYGSLLQMTASSGSDTLGPFVLSNSVVDTGTGTLTVNGDVTAMGICSIAGRVSLGAAPRTFNVPSLATDDLSIDAIVSDGGASPGGLTQIGAGTLRLLGANTYQGLTTVRGRLYVKNNSGLGAGETVVGSSTLVYSNAILYADNVNVTNEFLVLEKGATWYGLGNGSWGGEIFLDGDATLAVEDNGSFTLTNTISGLNGFTKSVGGKLTLAGNTANQYLGTTVVVGGVLALAKLGVMDQTINGPLIIGTNGGAPDTAVVRLSQDRQLANDVPVTIKASGWLDINVYSEDFGALSGNGNLTIGATGFLAVNGDNSSSTFDGFIGGEGFFDKEGLGTLTLTGNNTLTGDMQISDGTLLINGSQPETTVLVTGTLGGSGKVGKIHLEDGLISPGNSPGLLTCTNLLVSNSGTFICQLNGLSPGSGYDQLKVNGTVDLGDEMTALIVTLGFASALSNAFTIIDNDGTDAVTGIFDNYPEGANVNVSGTRFKISYTGGTGNDVVLTQMEPWQQPILSIRQTPGSKIMFSWPDIFTDYTLESSTNLSTNVWTVVVPPPVINFTNYVVTNTVTDPQKFFRLRLP